MNIKRIIPVLLLMLLITASSCHRSNRKDFSDRTRMAMNHNWHSSASRRMMPPWRRERMDGGMDRGRMPMMMDSIDMMPFGLGGRIEESLPNVTGSQKKQIADLMKKHQEEMKQLHEEMAAKMKSIMATHRNNILNVLTEEQKKFLGNPREEK